MHTDRIQETIALLLRIHNREGEFAANPKLSWNYAYWGQSNSADLHTCKTVACAAGYMTLHPPFQAQGLMNNTQRRLKEGYRRTDTDSSLDLLPCFTAKDTTKTGIRAIAAFLDISLTTASEIFVNLLGAPNPNYDPDEDEYGDGPNYTNEPVTPKDVADALQQLLDGTFPEAE